MAHDWFNCQTVDDNPSIERTDYVFVQEVEKLEDIPLGFFEAIVDYFEFQRLMPEEIERLDRFVQEGQRPKGVFRQKLLLAFAEGILGEDFQKLDEDAYLGTFSETVFKWIRESFLDTQIVDCEPRFVTGSSKMQGIDCFEILGNKNDIDSLYFIFWEVKGTDGEVKNRTNEIYNQHKKRTGRLLRNLQKKLADQYEREKEPVLCQFVSYLMDHWLTNSPQKHLGGCVLYSAAHQPGVVFSTFAKHFPDLADCSCRQVCLIQIPQFCKVRSKILELIWDRISLTPQL